MIEVDAIKSYFTGLQRGLIERLNGLDPKARQQADAWDRPEGGGGFSHLLAGGGLIEKGGINFSHVHGPGLPASATRRRPELANRAFQAMGVSVVLHPVNPFVPSTHMNVRFFTTSGPHEAKPTWWFGGGFDLTPCYPFLEDARDWHAAARRACQPYGPDLYQRFKDACDTYFFLPHRKETRGVGGLFFDDFDELGPADSFAMVRSIGDAFLPAWESIAEKRRHQGFGEREKSFQRYRRGRYVEFNLLYDRGTLFGLQSNGRTESILMSLPPTVEWIYDYTPPPGSPEESLTREFLQPKDWLNVKQTAKPSL